MQECPICQDILVQCVLLRVSTVSVGESFTSIPTDIVFIGPVGSGKSSLIGSLFRAVMEESQFPVRIKMTLNHPDEESHGTVAWLETEGNGKGTIVYQDTRGDQVGWLPCCFSLKQMSSVTFDSVVEDMCLVYRFQRSRCMRGRGRERGIGREGERCFFLRGSFCSNTCSKRAHVTAVCLAAL